MDSTSIQDDSRASLILGAAAGSICVSFIVFLCLSTKKSDKDTSATIRVKHRLSKGAAKPESTDCEHDEGSVKATNTDINRSSSRYERGRSSKHDIRKPETTRREGKSSTTSKENGQGPLEAKYVNVTDKEEDRDRGPKKTTVEGGSGEPKKSPAPAIPGAVKCNTDTKLSKTTKNSAKEEHQERIITTHPNKKCASVNVNVKSKSPRLEDTSGVRVFKGATTIEIPSSSHRKVPVTTAEGTSTSQTGKGGASAVEVRIPGAKPIVVATQGARSGLGKSETEPRSASNAGSTRIPIRRKNSSDKVPKRGRSQDHALRSEHRGGKPGGTVLHTISVDGRNTEKDVTVTNPEQAIKGELKNSPKDVHPKTETTSVEENPARGGRSTTCNVPRTSNDNVAQGIDNFENKTAIHSTNEETSSENHVRSPSPPVLETEEIEVSEMVGSVESLTEVARAVSIPAEANEYTREGLCRARSVSYVVDMIKMYKEKTASLPLAEHVIERILADAQENIDACTICLEDFDSPHTEELGVVKRCCHLFHYDCLWDWLGTQHSCPLCRKDVNPFNSFDIALMRRSDFMNVKQRYEGLTGANAAIETKYAAVDFSTL